MTENKPSPRLGWIGLGNMGLAMATNLQKHLLKESHPSLRYNNRTIGRGAPLRAIEGNPCDTVAEVVSRTDIIFISMSDDSAVHAVIEQVLKSTGLAGKIIVDTSTIHPDTTREVNNKLKEIGATLIAAPVFGATPVAERGQLLFAIAGPSTAVDTVLPFIQNVLARSVIRVGEDVRLATLLKTTGNFITASMAETIAEAHVFAEKTGLPTSTVDKLIQQNYGTYAHSISEKLVTGVYAPPRGERPRSDLRLAIKDVSHGVESARAAGVQLKVGELTLQHLLRAKELADERPLDSSAVYGIIRQDAALDFETDFIKNRDAKK